MQEHVKAYQQIPTVALMQQVSMKRLNMEITE